MSDWLWIYVIGVAVVAAWFGFIGATDEDGWEPDYAREGLMALGWPLLAANLIGACWSLPAADDGEEGSASMTPTPTNVEGGGEGLMACDSTEGPRSGRPQEAPTPGMLRQTTWATLVLDVGKAADLERLKAWSPHLTQDEVIANAIMVACMYINAEREGLIQWARPQQITEAERR